MSKKKGVSAEEKRVRMLELFREKDDFYQLKELEKIAPKEKGIVAQSVKDVVQSLVDDGLVDTDKIGTSVYYWSYPGKGLNVKKRELEKLEAHLAILVKNREEASDRLSKAKIGKEDSDERRALLKEVDELQTKEQQLLNKISVYKDNDPEALNAMKTSIQKQLEVANRWTDNIFTLKSWCRDKFQADEKTIDKQFNIPEDFDYID